MYVPTPATATAQQSRTRRLAYPDVGSPSDPGPPPPTALGLQRAATARGMTFSPARETVHRNSARQRSSTTADAAAASGMRLAGEGAYLEPCCCMHSKLPWSGLDDMLNWN